MRFGVFNPPEGASGGRRLAVIEAEQAVDVTDLLGLDPHHPGGPLHHLLEQGPGTLPDAPSPTAPRRPVAELAWEAPLPRPGKLMGAPANYYDHVDEMPDSATITEWGLFLKAGTSTLGHGGVVRLPWSDRRTDHEGELGVVIGRTARHVPAERALEHVFGYTCVLDITVRSTEDRSLRKSFDTFTPMGPWVVTADEIPDPGDLELSCSVNGELRQHTSTAKLIYGVAELIAYASAAMTLHPGDVIATGTPAGVGPLADGDTVQVDIDAVGSLMVTVSAEGAIPYQARPGSKVSR
ncbi:fumarylacetoacetate hydrolase family protein [Actinomadura sp. NPDC048032]|uniref:fumarylacetoacetate hydrolase family protein n=1 Tax=Actinomadura sp. NPDC048032 TaxID=3155747 RepID=UPI0033C4BF3E